MELEKKQTIVLARHGQTNFNTEGKIQDPVGPRLTEIGHQQAMRLGREINRLGLKFDLVICADTTRNIETLKEIYPNYKQIVYVKIDKRLQERYHADLVGKTKDDIESALGEKLTDRLSWHLYFENTDKSQLTRMNYTNNESLKSVKERLISLLSEIKEKDNVLLLGSSVTNQYILEYLEYGTIGVQRPQLPSGGDIDFQENEELRIVALDENMKIKNYRSVRYQ